MAKKYTIDEIFTHDIQEDVVKDFCLLHFDVAEEEEVRSACKVLLKYCSVPGEDYDGILD